MSGALPVETSVIAPTVWVVPVPTIMQRLAERRISPQTIAVFDIQPSGNGWRYPVPGGGYRWKNANSEAVNKYTWPDGKPEGVNFYHTQDLASAINQAGGACWYVSGEADVWAMHSAGVMHVLSGFTESHVSPHLLAYLESMGVTVLYIAPDLDPTGAYWARLIDQALQESAIELDARKLSPELGEHGDLGKAWTNHTRQLSFERWLLGLTRFRPEPVAPTSNPTPADNDKYSVPLGYRELIADILGVQGYKADGNSVKNVSCPFHDDKHPSASLHREKGLYCHACGRLYLWSETGVKLGAGSLLEWRLSNSCYTMSTELREALVKTRHTSLARLLDAFAQEGWQPGRQFTRKEALAACCGLLSSSTVRSALVSLCGFFPPFSLEPVKSEKTSTNSQEGRPAISYRLPEPAELSRGLSDRYGIKVYPRHFDDIPADKIRKAADYRAEVYAALPKHKPGQYARKTLAGRVGVSNRTGASYDQRAGLIVTPNFERHELTSTDINRLPNYLPRDRKYNLWLEDEHGTKYSRIKKNAECIAKCGKVYLVQQFANTYAAGVPH